MCTDESPLYLAVNYKYLNDSIVHKQKIGKDRIITIIKRMAGTSGWSGEKTNHSACKILVIWVTKNDISETQIMQ